MAADGVRSAAAVDGERTGEEWTGEEQTGGERTGEECIREGEGSGREREFGLGWRPRAGCWMYMVREILYLALEYVLVPACRAQGASLGMARGYRLC